MDANTLRTELQRRLTSRKDQDSRSSEAANYLAGSLSELESLLDWLDDLEPVEPLHLGDSDAYANYEPMLTDEEHKHLFQYLGEFPNKLAADRAVGETEPETQP